MLAGFWLQASGFGYAEALARSLKPVARSPKP